MMFLISAVFIPLFPFLLFIAVSRIWCRKRRDPNAFAFFHPYCNAGGGGERVLWLAINAIHKRFAQNNARLRFVIYTGDIDRSPEQILEKAYSRFGVSVHADRLHFVFLRWRYLLEPLHYPRLTLLGQLLAGLVVGGEALFRHCPRWFIDTTGCPLTLPLFRWIGGATTMCYVHYPVITTEMIALVDSRTVSYNNSSGIASSTFLSNAKMFYYRLISLIYRICGNSSQLTMANGSWTCGHIAQLWDSPPRIVFPPCDVATLCTLDNQSEDRLIREGTVLILSVGQIRPEKNHLEQLAVFGKVRRFLRDSDSELKVRKGVRQKGHYELQEVRPYVTRGGSQTKLVIAGGCRDAEDWERTNFLKKYALGNFQLESGEQIDDPSADIVWRLNIPFDELVSLFQEAMIGLHTMWNEHFGISVVEGMAAGTLMVAHNSGGPKMDIIGELSSEDSELLRCGFLAATTEEYSAEILKILEMDRYGRDRIRAAARQRVQRFSDSEFERTFCAAICPLLDMDSS